jgi:ribosome-binding protein aMBF1 (putative translation factor)
MTSALFTMPYWHEPKQESRTPKFLTGWLLLPSSIVANEEREKDFQRRLGVLMAHLRESRGMSQEALAVQLTCDQSYVSRIESSERQLSLPVLIEWVEALGLDFLEVAGLIQQTWHEAGQGDG